MAERILVKVESELASLMPRFLANRHRDLETIAQGLAALDFERLRRTGHDMKGVGAGYGFVEMSLSAHTGMFLSHSHQHGNILIKIDGDRAYSETYGHVTLRRRDENGQLIDTSGELDGVAFSDAAGLAEQYATRRAWYPEVPPLHKIRGNQRVQLNVFLAKAIVTEWPRPQAR